ncbi:MAG: outer membrane protein transport protein [Kiritimatiellae bacterium]|nr:outer membrane protein transport protein [Kiritimatiellia bacterium]
METSRRSFFALLGLVVLCVAPRIARGAGFAIVEQSGRTIGQAFAGATVSAADPSCLYFNPACATKLSGDNAAVAAHLILPTFEFNNEGSNYPLLGGVPLAGDNGGNGGVDAFVPNLYGTHQMSDRLTLGVSINAPYGLTTEYDAGWVGRYQGLKTELTTLHVTPSAAWKINDRFSIGAGLSAAYIEADLTSAVDLGGILAAQGVPGAVPQALDGRAKVEGDDWGLGFNLGLLAAPTESSRIGMAYRSPIQHTLEGDATFSVPAAAQVLNSMGLFVDCDGKADLDLPETVSLGASQKVGDALTLFADVMWTGWSRFDELRVEYDSAQPDSVTEEDWEDTWRYAVGVSYDYSDKWTLRVGTAYDETPIPDKEHRTPRIPDGDRLWLALGAGYQAAEDVVVDAAYVHLFIDDTDVDHIGPTGDRLLGTYEGEVDILSLQVTWRL